MNDAMTNTPDAPVPPTRELEIEKRLRDLAGRLCGVAQVLQLISDTGLLEPDSQHALGLALTVTDEAYIEIHELVDESHDLRAALHN